MVFSDAFRMLRHSGPAGWAVAAVVLAQIAVPAAAFVDEPPTRFGFQMYSGLGEVLIEVKDSQGRLVDVEVESFLPAPLRPDVDWTRTLPERLCAEVAEAASVAVVQPDGRRTLPCD